ncbi:hypothetical protein OS493_005694 [Desmophyllum pertusum]|uniref:G-protein coupled receptors family 1 profile domain-containing protein n=1 Tax=Desmophyllum pertusum TaxID=174260 RepID=A0A9X0CPH6_9CNID|nr:hypothetical protein OS493_005694 [Desmophyllum pertusum]
MASSTNVSNGPTISSVSPALVQYYSEPPGLVIARLTFEATLAVLGVLGNILVCVVIARMRTKTAINRYLFNLGIADIGVLLVVFPMAVLQEQVKSYFPLGKGICLYVYPVIDTFYGASIWLVTSVAVERYINIVRRVEVYRGRSLTTSTLTIVAIWLISFSVVSLPLFFVTEYDEKTSACVVNWFRKPSFLHWRQVYTITLTMFTYVLPLGIISWTYVQIGSRLTQSTGFHKEIERKCSTVSYGKNAKRKKKGENNRLKENTKAKRILTPIVFDLKSEEELRVVKILIFRFQCRRINKSIMSSNDIFAEPMLDTKDYLQEYKNQLAELDNKGVLPILDEQLEYKVYSYRGSDFGAHKSIVLTSDDEHFVSVELGFTEVKGKKHIYPVTRSVDKSAKMEYLGVIEATFQELIGKAVAVMKKFGGYFKLCNNCQDYSNMYLEAIGLKQAQKLTDGDKLSIGVIVAAIVVFLFTLMRN